MRVRWLTLKREITRKALTYYDQQQQLKKTTSVAVKMKQMPVLPVYVSCLILILVLVPITAYPYATTPYYPWYYTADRRTQTTKPPAYPWFFTTRQRTRTQSTPVYPWWFVSTEAPETTEDTTTPYYPWYHTAGQRTQTTKPPAYPWFFTTRQRTRTPGTPVYPWWFVSTEAPETTEDTTTPYYPWYHTAGQRTQTTKPPAYPWFFTTRQRTRTPGTPVYPWWFVSTEAPETTKEAESFTTTPEIPNRCQVCRDIQCFTGPQVVTCSAQQPLCSSRITDTSGSMGGRAVVKGCVSRSQCDAWTPSDNDLRFCPKVDRLVSGRDIDCLYCCHGDLCNKGPAYIPARETWVGKNQQGLDSLSLPF